ncbi:hypothetical protein ASZ78_015706 [Callipepla squamata]|uniref:Uncharacterized protein n=1 Tax=Callipepla squamata TaxID=9009 RepID=A0A226NN97_CALSU|nr:hypothetical protein ASZ78_015706 [Callipepla squamata]
MSVDFFLHIRNYGGVYVGLPSDAAAMVSSQTKAASKELQRGEHIGELDAEMWKLCDSALYSVLAKFHLGN